MILKTRKSLGPPSPRYARYLARAVASLAPETRITKMYPTPLGLRSLAYMVETDGDHQFVFKRFKDLKKAMAVAIASRHLLRAGLPVPRLLRLDLWPRFVPGIRAYVTAEERINGTPVALLEDTNHGCEATGRLLAHLHSITRRRHGGPLLGRSGCYVDWMLSRELGRLKRIRHGMDCATRVAAAEALRNRAAQVPKHSVHSLLHGDINTGNVLLAPGGAWLVDLVDVHYGHRCRELCGACQEFPSDPEDRKTLIRAYSETAGEDIEEELARSSSFFHLIAACGNLLRASRRFHRASAEDKPRILERLTACSAKLQACIEDPSGTDG